METLHNIIDGINVTNPDFTLLSRVSVHPTRLAEGAVHIPFEKINLICADQIIECVENVFMYLRPGKVQDKLVASLGTRSIGETINPVGMCAIKIAIRVDHLRFYPQPELHAT